jgi:tripartite-type tricarboxylate transporter receptor subunit TctC
MSKCTLAAVAAFATGALMAFWAFGYTTYFTRNQSDRITLVVGFAPGGTSSTAARFIADSVQDITGANVIVENKPGAGGKIAAEYVKGQNNPRTLLFMSSTSLLDVPPDLGLVPIGVIATFKYVAVAKMHAPATLSEYMSAAKSKREHTLCYVGTAGSVPEHLGIRLFEEHGAEMVNVPYKGSAPAIRDVAGGHVAMTIVPLPDFQAFKGQLPVIAETGNGIELEGWIAVFAPPRTSTKEAERLSKIFRHASGMSKDDLERTGFRQEWQSAEELMKMYSSQLSYLKLPRKGPIEPK